jgi:MFS family permease
MHGRVDEALDVLQKLCATGDEAQVLWSEAAPPEEWSGGLGVWKEMFLHPTPPVRRMLVAGMGVLFVQHLSGINGVQLYSARVFKAVGIASTNEILAANIGVGLAKTVFILTAILLVDRVGRRGLYLSSLAGVIVSLSCLGLSLTVIEHSKPNQDVPWPRAAIASVFTFVASFSIGLGPITGAYSSEVIPLRLRAQGVGVGVAFNRVANATVALTFISLSNAITMGGAFFLFGFLSVGAATFFYFFCPETQGRPLEEIEEVFRQGWRERRHNLHGPFHVFKHTEMR